MPRHGVLASAEMMARWLATNSVLDEVASEREAQFQQWGDEDVSVEDFIDSVMDHTPSRDDLVQIAATAVHLIEQIDRDALNAG